MSELAATQAGARGRRPMISSDAPVLSWSIRRPRRLLFAAHVPFLLIAPLTTALGLNAPPQNSWLVTSLTLGVAGLALRHSFAAARGVAPTGWPISLGVLGLLAFLPLPWFQYGWGTAAWFFIAAAAMFMTGPLRLVVALGPLIGVPLWLTLRSFSAYSVPTDVYVFVFWLVGLAYGAGCLYGATLLMRAADELFSTREELADAAVGRERLRLGRDLHDFLGQSLSAVSLKGDLALALLRSDSRPAAESEIQSITNLARDSLRDIRRVVYDEQPMSLAAETRGVGALLAAANVRSEIALNVGDLPPSTDELLGWAAREGVTNVLRHSDASGCTIRADRENGAVVLEIVNDGARRSASASGSGIAGLSERARTVGGSVTAGELGDGRFRLRVEIPDVIP